jgi:hypothetical protein
MRDLNFSEIDMIVGGAKATIKAGGFEASIEGDASNLGESLTNAYEGVVSFVSHVIERVASVF